MSMKGKKVVVTGADGFIGSHLVEELVAEGARVRAFCLYNSFNSYGWIDSLPKKLLKKIDIFMGDVRDPHGVYKALKGRDVVFHLAALIGIPYSYHSPDSYVDTNISGTLHVLQAAKSLGLDRVIVTSSSEVYGTARYVPIDEAHPLQAQSPYSATKIAADKIAQSFHHSFSLPVTIVRPFNTFGPRQSARAIIPTIILQLLSRVPRLQLGNVAPTRDLVFVKDTARAFIDIAQSRKTIGLEINVATQTEVSIKTIAETLMRLMHVDTKIVVDKHRVRPKKSEVQRLLGSNKKIKKLTAWLPRYSFAAGLQETIDWFLRYENTFLRTYKANIYNV